MTAPIRPEKGIEKTVEQLLGVTAERIRATPLEILTQSWPRKAPGLISTADVDRQLDQALRSI